MDKDNKIKKINNLTKLKNNCENKVQQKKCNF